MEKTAFIQNYGDGFSEETEKLSDLIPGHVYQNLTDYNKRTLVEIKQTIEEATKKGTKLPTRIRQRMLEAAFESLKNMSWGLARTAIPKAKIAISPDWTEKKPPASL